MTQDSRHVVRAFMDAWERADADAVLAVMSDNAVYRASVGPEPGMTYAGGELLERGVREMLAFEAGGESRQGQLWFSGEHAFAEWSYDEIAGDGSVTEIRGIDVMHIVDGKIYSIDAYRKTAS